MHIAGKTKLEVGDKSLKYTKSTASEIYDEDSLRKYIEEDKERIKSFYKELSKPDIRKDELKKAITATKKSR